jgi:CRISPR-associated protein Csb1
MFEKLKGANRLLLETDLKPVQGDRFQPTGFADLGAAVYERPDGKRMLLVESAQSMANRLEHACLLGDGPDITPELKGLPYIVSELTGSTNTRTSSLIEAHRINSPYIISDGPFQKAFSLLAAYEKGKVIDWKSVAKALFHYDPNSLLHGAFLANLEDGRIKVPRLLTAFVEAEDIHEAASGGVKNNPLDPTGKIRAVAEPGNVYSNVPYHRMEYTAGKITAYFNIDLSLIDGYELQEEAKDLLITLSLYKIRRFLEGALRLRTACDLTVKGTVRVTAPEKFVMPDTATLLADLQKGLKACNTKGLFASPPVTIVKCPTKVVKKEEKTKDSDGDSPEDETEK